MQAIYIFRENPFLRFLLPFILGIAYIHFIKDLIISDYLSITLVITALLILTYFIVVNLKNKYIPGYISFLTFIIFGIISYNLKTNHYHFSEENLSYHGIIEHQAIEKPKSFEVDCIIKGLYLETSMLEVKEKVRLYFPKDSLLVCARVGDSIDFTASLRPISNRGNPGEFDYKAYMLNDGYKYTGYLPREAYHIGDDSKTLRIRRTASLLKNKLIAQFTKYKIEGDELAVLSALTAGDRTLIDQNLKHQYASAGAMHILAVSGLHIGILYLFLNLLLGKRIQNKAYRISRLIIILACLWFYALITGLSTSVMRASIMFSMFLIGNSFSRQANSYNLLAASALIILLINPLEIFKPGFQFSYLAVLGILLFQARIESLLPPFKWLVFERIWQLISVSIAAQLLTFPLTLYYFNQFPSYFLLTNMLIIPLVWLIMILTLLFTIFSGIAFLGKLLSYVLNFMLHINNFGVAKISSLPGSSITDIHFNLPHLIISFLLILSIIYGLYFLKRRHIIWIISVYILGIFSIQLAENFLSLRRNELIIYNSDINPCISIIKSKNHILLRGEIQSDNQENSLTYLKPYWNSEGILKDIHHLQLQEYQGVYSDCGNFNLSKNESRFILNNLVFSITNLRKDWQSNVLPYKSEKEQNLLLIDVETGYPTAYGKFNFSGYQLILSPLLSEHVANSWRDRAEQNNFGFHNLKTEGALQIKF